MRPRRLVVAALLTLGALAAAAPAGATDFVVDDFSDAPDADVADPRCLSTLGTCTLRAAVMQSNADTASARRAPDTISVGEGTYRLTIPSSGPTRGEAGELWVSRYGDLTIRGAGADRTIIEQTAGGRVLYVHAARNITVEELTITGGNVVDDPRGGGGIANSAERMTLRSVTVRGNHSDLGGGGIANVIGFLHVTDSLVTNNSAHAGGGIAAFGTLDVLRSTISGNTAETGAGIGWGTQNVGRVSFLLRESVVASNRAEAPTEWHAHGGGIELRLAGCCAEVLDVRIIDTTIRENSSTGEGGGLYTYAFGLVNVERTLFQGNTAYVGGGAAIRSRSDFVNTTFSGNSAEAGGAIFQEHPLTCFADVVCAQSSVRLQFSTLTGNSSGAGRGSGIGSDSLENSLQLVGTILDNIPADENCRDVADSLGSNIDTGTSCHLTGPGDLSSTNPRLRDLADNGGWTWTHALRDDSPAIDAATFSRCPRFDQRLGIRPAGERCDIGAYEAGAMFFVFPIHIVDPGIIRLFFAASTADTLSKDGVKLGASTPAELAQDGLTLSEPLAEAWLGERRSRLLGRGGLRLIGPKGAVELSDWELQLADEKGFVHARIGSRKLPLLVLSEATRTGEGWFVSGKARALLHEAAADALNKALGTKVFTGGMDVGLIEFSIDAEGKPDDGDGQEPPPPSDNPNG